MPDAGEPGVVGLAEPGDHLGVDRAERDEADGGGVDVHADGTVERDPAQLGAHDGAEVAALGAEPVVAEAAHEARPRRRPPGSRSTRCRPRAGEAEPGDRGDHQVEGVGRVAAVAPRVAERVDDVEELDDQYGQPWVSTSGRAPSSGERTCRKWTRVPSIVVVNWGSSSRTGLGLAPVVGRGPIPGQLPGGRRSACPGPTACRAARRPTGCRGQAVGQIVEVGLRASMRNGWIPVPVSVSVMRRTLRTIADSSCPRCLAIWRRVGYLRPAPPPAVAPPGPAPARPGPELAERLAVDVRTVRRDVDRLRGLGYPVHATPGAAGGYRLEAGGDLPPLLLDDEEAVAIAVGLRTAAGGSVAGIEEASARALAKLEQVLPDRLRGRLSAVSSATVAVPRGSPPGRPGLLSDLAAAAQDHHRLRFDYTRHDGTTGRRTIRAPAARPQAPPGRTWWRGTPTGPAGGPSGSTGWRRRPSPWPGSPRPPPADDLAAWVAEGAAVRAYRHVGVVTLHAPAEQVAERLSPTAGVLEALDDRTCRLTTGARPSARSPSTWSTSAWSSRSWSPRSWSTTCGTWPGCCCGRPMCRPGRRATSLTGADDLRGRDPGRPEAPKEQPPRNLSGTRDHWGEAALEPRCGDRGDHPATISTTGACC